jgi:hypothetical protein
MQCLFFISLVTNNLFATDQNPEISTTTNALNTNPVQNQVNIGRSMISLLIFICFILILDL